MSTSPVDPSYLRRRTAMLVILLMLLGLLVSGCSEKAVAWTDDTPCGSWQGPTTGQEALRQFLNAAKTQNSHDLCLITDGITYGQIKKQVAEIHRFLDSHSQGTWRYTVRSEPSLEEWSDGMVSYKDRPVSLVALINKAWVEHLDDPGNTERRMYVEWPDNGLLSCPQMADRFADMPFADLCSKVPKQ